MFAGARVIVVVASWTAGCASAPTVGGGPEVPREIVRRAAEAGERVGARRDVDTLAARPPRSFEAGFEVGRGLFEAGRRRDAARVWEQVAERWPAHAHAPKALFNAAVAWTNAGDRASALGAFGRIAERYPEDALAGPALEEMSLALEEGGRLDEALGALMQLLASGGDWKRSDAGVRACQLAWTLGRADEAVSACRSAAREVEGEGLAPELLLRAAETLEGAGRLVEAGRVVDEALRRGRRAPDVEVMALVARARVAKALGRATVARKAEERVLRLVLAGDPDAGRRAGDRSLRSAAEILLARADAAAARADAIALETGDMKALRRSLDAKAKAMRAVVTAYEAVFEARAPVPSARAAIGTGRLYERFCEQVLAVPRMVPDDIYDAYRGALEDLLAPIQDRAAAAYEVALRVAEDAPEVAEEAARGLLRLRPDRYPVGRVAALGLPWGRGAPTPSAPDEDAARRAVWERPHDVGALLDLAVVEHRAGRERVAEYFFDRVWTNELGARGEREALRLAEVAAVLGRAGLARRMILQGSGEPDAAGRAEALLGAAQLAVVAYRDAAESFRRAAAAAGEPRCEVPLGGALAAVGEAGGDPSRYPGDGLERYVSRCPSPDPLALLWLARKRATDGDDAGAEDLCRRYLAAPSTEDPTGGVAYCEASVTSAPRSATCAARPGTHGIVPAGALDDDPGARPERIVHWASRAPWHPAAIDALPRRDEGR